MINGMFSIHKYIGKGYSQSRYHFEAGFYSAAEKFHQWNPLKAVTIQPFKFRIHSGSLNVRTFRLLGWLENSISLQSESVQLHKFKIKSKI